MPELIYRDVAKFQACNWKVKSNDDAIFDSIKESIKRLLDLAPAVDAVPVVHGWWVGFPECLGYDGAYSDDHIVCSNCKSVWSIIDNDAERFDYCPRCGAKMDGERKEDERGNNNDSPADH